MSFVLPPEFDRRYPVVVRGEGVWLEDSDGKRSNAWPNRWLAAFTPPIPRR